MIDEKQINSKLSSNASTCYQYLSSLPNCKGIKFWVSNDIDIDQQKHLKILIEEMLGINCINYDTIVRVIVIPNNAEWHSNISAAAEKYPHKYKEVQYSCTHKPYPSFSSRFKQLCSTESNKAEYKNLKGILANTNCLFIALSDFYYVSEIKRISTLSWHTERGLPAECSDRNDIFCISQLAKSKHLQSEVYSLHLSHNPESCHKVNYESPNGVSMFQSIEEKQRYGCIRSRKFGKYHTNSDDHGTHLIVYV